MALPETSAAAATANSAGVVCGAATALAGVLETIAGQKFPVTEVLNGGAVPFGIAFAAGLYLAQYERMGRFGGWAFAVHFLSFGYFAGIAFTMNFVLVHLDPAVVGHLLDGPARWAFLATAALTLLGTWLFSAALWLVRVVPPFAVGCYAAGLTALSLTFLLPAPIVRVGHVFVGAGTIWLATWLRAAAGRAADRLPQYS
ncbi:hypothetical protein ACFXPS_18230 [Nocardia sp. NPDC059091]|uniref:hypothetical protein n=1 Tax=Nocardia sp. NPDC059091 TaxID=3346724 RepID=UPI0036BFB549